MKSPAQILNSWSQLIEADPTRFAGFSESYIWTIPGPGGGSWILCAAKSPPLQPLTAGGGSRCRIEITAEALEQLASGSLNPQAALIEQKLKLSGPAASLIELNFILDRLIPELPAAPVLQ